MSVPSDAPVWRPLFCPVCKRFLGVAEAKSVVYCKQCRDFQRADPSKPAPRHIDIGPRVRELMSEEEDDDPNR